MAPVASVSSLRMLTRFKPRNKAAKNLQLLTRSQLKRQYQAGQNTTALIQGIQARKIHRQDSAAHQVSALVM
jgi:hypothetical protein